MTEPEKVKPFEDLGCTVSYSDSEWLSLKKNLTKARNCFARISHVLVLGGATLKVAGMFFRAQMVT
jgi:riboflavin biosynthesis pyrimidine reductase